MADKLTACPFCGATKYIQKSWISGDPLEAMRGWCADCDAYGPPDRHWRKAWNSRHEEYEEMIFNDD